MALSATDIANLLFKKLQGKSSTNNSREFFEEPRDGRTVVFLDQVWAQSGDIPTTAPGGIDQAITGVVQRWIDLSLTAVAGVSNSFYSDDLIDAIPFNFGDGTYNFELKDSGASAIAFGQGDWIVDPATGTLTFYGTVPSNMPPTISFYKYVGTKGSGSGASTGFVEHAVTDGQAATALTDETWVAADYTSAEYDFEIIRGTTVNANGKFVLQKQNGSWIVVLGPYMGNIHGVTFTLTGTTTQQLNAALDTGAGSGTLKLSRRLIE